MEIDNYVQETMMGLLPEILGFSHFTFFVELCQRLAESSGFPVLIPCAWMAQTNSHADIHVVEVP